MRRWWQRRDALDKQILFVLGTCAMIISMTVLTVSAATGHWEMFIAYVFVILSVGGVLGGIAALFKLAAKIFPDN